MIVVQKKYFTCKSNKGYVISIEGGFFYNYNNGISQECDTCGKRIFDVTVERFYLSFELLKVSFIVMTFKNDAILEQLKP